MDVPVTTYVVHLKLCSYVAYIVLMSFALFSVMCLTNE